MPVARARGPARAPTRAHDRPAPSAAPALGWTLLHARARLWRPGTGFTPGLRQHTLQAMYALSEPPRRHSLKRLLLAACGWTGAVAGAGLMTGCGQTRTRTRLQTDPQDPGRAPPAWRRLGPGVWWAEGAAGEPDAANRGQVAHLLAVQAGAALWLIGSGPSPAAGQRLRRGLELATGQPVTDLLNPWAHPALVLGNRAFFAAPHPARGWAHDEVAAALQRQCARCVQRLRAQLGAAAAELGDDPVALPAQLLRGDSGTLAGGRLQWWRVARDADSVATLWAVPAAALLFAPGLLWTGAPPDLADVRLQSLQAATAQVLRHLGRGWRVLGQQGPIGRRSDVQDQAHYLQALAVAVRERQAAGALETEAAPELQGVAPAWQRHQRHAFNWQRAWRALEDESLPLSVPNVPTEPDRARAASVDDGVRSTAGLRQPRHAPIQGRDAFQRSLR